MGFNIYTISIPFDNDLHFLNEYHNPYGVEGTW